MCYGHGLFKGLWHNALWFNDCQVRSVCFFSQDALQYMRSYLTNRQQRVRVNSNFNTSENIIAGIPQGAILGSLLFNIFINYVFLFISNS